jgi:uncharacterized protein YcbK (DUF882 family)
MTANSISHKAPNFSYEELCRSKTATTRGISNNPSDDVKRNLRQLAEQYLQPLRDKYGPVIVSSAYRNPMVNKAVGGSRDSWHLKGCAADIVCPSMYVAIQFANFFIERFERHGVGFDELILSCNRNNSYWLHVAFNPSGNHRLRCSILRYS